VKSRVFALSATVSLILGRLSKVSIARLCLAVLMMAAIVFISTSAAAAEPSTGPVVRVGSEAITRLYGQTTARTEGAVASQKYLPENMIMRWVGQGSMTWQVRTSEPGDYEVALCYGAIAAAEGAKFEIVSSDSRIKGTVHKTSGMYRENPSSEEKPVDKDYVQNYERVHLKGVLHLPAGVSTITIRVIEPESGDVMDLRSMELTPVAAKASIAAAEERARKSRASTDWFVKAKYGVMFHWEPNSQPRHGPKKPYAEAVRDFDVNAFADMVEDTGAGYVIFTLNHGHSQWPAPIESWEKIHPGWTTERDLVGDMADVLDKRGIKLMLYIASHCVVEDALSCDSISSGEEAIDVHVETLKEMGSRYGRKLAGYWFDGWDIIPQVSPDAPTPFERLFNATKTGNPERIISSNYWLFPDATGWQEYWAGEIDGPLKPARGRYIEYSAGEGLQLHALIMLEDIWVHSEPNSEMPSPTFTEQELIDFVRDITDKQGVVTINLGIYQDGRIGEESAKAMRTLRKALGK